MKLVETKQKRGRDVLTRLVEIVQWMAGRNTTFRGTKDRLHQPGNGNFLKEVELMAKFDSVLKQHIDLVVSGVSHISYLGKDIQNELPECVERFWSKWSTKLKQSKYFSIILDCTPDFSRREQLSLIVPYVVVENPTPHQNNVHLLGFLEVEQLTFAT